MAIDTNHRSHLGSSNVCLIEPSSAFRPRHHMCSLDHGLQHIRAPQRLVLRGGRHPVHALHHAPTAGGGSSRRNSARPDGGAGPSSGGSRDSADDGDQDWSWTRLVIDKSGHIRDTSYTRLVVVYKTGQIQDWSYIAYRKGDDGGGGNGDADGDDVGSAAGPGHESWCGTGQAFAASSGAGQAFAAPYT